MRSFSLISVLLTLVIVSADSVSGQSPNQKVALLVGVNQYQKRGFKNLDYAERDVTELETELKKLGFRTVLLTGSAEGDRKATRKNIETQLLTLLRDIGKEDIVLVSLSGHGQQLTVTGPNGEQKDDGFYCPYDAEIGDASSLFSLSYLTDEILAKKGGRNLVLVDACRDPLKDPGRGARGVQGKIVSLPEDTALFFSCRAGQQSFESDVLQHGVFTYCLLQGLRGEAVKGNNIAWTNLVAHVEERMASDEMKKYLPKPQEPIPAGGVGRTVLGTLDPSKPSLLFAPFSAGEAKASQAAWAKALGKPVIEKNEIGGEMVLVPPGEFLMGSSDDDIQAAIVTSGDKRLDDKFFSSERPQHRVRITKPFRMGMHEVTQGEYKQVLGNNPSYYSKSGRGHLSVGDFDTDRLPVEQISWFDAVEYCNKLSNREELKPYYSITNIQRKDGIISSADVTVVGGNGYRLPSEAEWEYACRAGTTTAFHFGDVTSDKDATTGGYNPLAGTPLDHKSAPPKPVGSFAANSFGLRDMHGNVAEYSEDTYDYSLYQRAFNLAIDPSPLPLSADRIVRGGSWIDHAVYCRSAYRSSWGPKYSSPSFRVGFRVARTP